MKLPLKLATAFAAGATALSVSAVGIPAAAAVPAVHTTHPPTAQKLLSVRVSNVASVTEPTLRQGSRGSAVELLQRKLGGLKVDGVFGPITRDHVETYQSRHHLTIDGVVGPHTWASLLGTQSGATSQPHASRPILSVGMSGPNVAELQYYLGGLVVDGDFGPKTKARLASFQRSQGLPATGVANAKTWQTAINKGPGASPEGLGIDPRAIQAAAPPYYWSVAASKKTNRLYLLRYDTARHKVLVALSTPTSFGGCNKDGCFTTPSGIFHVTRKDDQDHRSNEWFDSNGVGYIMPWPVFFYGGVSIHYDPLGNSHECVHVPVMWKAKYIHDHLPLRATVVISG